MLSKQRSLHLVDMDSIAHDHQLRALLKTHLGARTTPEDLVVDEFCLPYGAVRADLALINGHLEGFEIKAGKDTLDRLAHQVDAYAKVFEFSWVVTTSAHLSNVRALVPRRWGLLVASVDGDAASLRQVRKAQRNGLLDATHLVRLLWREEVLGKLDEMGLSKGLKSKPKLALYEALAQAMPVTALADYVRECLKRRATWRVDPEPRGYGGSSRRVAR